MALSDSQRDRKKKKQDTILSKKKEQHLKETRAEDGNLLIPEGVVDEAAYRKYIKLYEEVHNDPNVFYYTSDPDIQVNLLSSNYRVAQLISSLPLDEQLKIQSISSRLRSMGATAAFYKRKSFGGKMRNHESVKMGGASKLHVNFFEQYTQELIEMFGRYFNAEEVYKIVNIDWGHHIPLNAIRQFKLDNIERIHTRQDEWRNSIGDVRLTYKKSRLEELTYLYNTRKEIYGKTSKIDDGRELRCLIESVRKEVEGDTLTINGSLTVSHELLIKEQIDKNLMQGINLKALIIGRAAAKLNVNPMVLQYQLVNSYYAKFTGFKPADSNIQTDEIIYPSSYIYDFDMLRNKNKEVMAEDAEIIEGLEVNVGLEEKEKIADIKDNIRKKLIEQRTINQKSKEIINSKRIDNDGKEGSTKSK